MHLSQDELAERWGFSDGNYVYMLESGRKPFPRKLEERLLELEAEVRKKRTELSQPGEALVLRDEVRPGGRLVTRPVPVVSWARAGAADFNYSDLAEFLDETVQTECRDPNAFALIVEGDSMEPMYRPGDRLIISPNVAARNGNVVIARLMEEGSVLFKLFHQTGPNGETIRLTSYNPIYPALEFHIGRFRFIYPVYEMRRKTI